MDKLFSGSVYLLADEKGRYRLPTKYRTQIDGALCYLNNGSPYLTITSQSKKEEIIESLRSSITLVDSEASEAARALIASMDEIKEDGQNRFTLPQSLKTELHIGREVVFVGMGTKIEMWGKEEWEASRDRIKKSDGYKNMLSQITITL